MRYVKVGMKYLLALLFVGAGINHFVHPDFYVRIVPPYLPWPFFLVIFSGICELVLGLMLLVPSLGGTAAWGLVALLIAVFPANVHMALHADLYPEFSLLGLWMRLPVQGLVLAWAYWFTRGAPTSNSANSKTD